jgi:ankyrin repeat protein
MFQKKTKSGNTALHVASYDFSDESLVKVLLDNGADVNAMNEVC